MDGKELRAQFERPGSAYRGKPFWSWNGELEKGELLRQMDVMEQMGFGGFFMHSRSGLITEYMGDQWFDCINALADAGAGPGDRVAVCMPKGALQIASVVFARIKIDTSLGGIPTFR